MSSEPINIHTYEVFFLDFLDGNLSEERLSELNSFLDNHPELKEELNYMKGVENDIKLKAENISFTNKDLLLKDTPEKLFEISELEYLCISDAENDIDEDEKIFLNKLISEKEKFTVFNQFKKTKLSPNTDIVYPYKHLLKKDTVSAVLIRSISAVAAASVIIFFALKLNFGDNENHSDITAELSQKNQSEIIKKLNDKTTKTINKQTENTENKQAINTHNQTIKVTNKNLLAFEDTESQQKNNLYKELAIPIPDIKVETLISNTENPVQKNYIPTNFNYVSEKQNLSNRDKFLKIAEKGVGFWKRITNDDGIELKNEYTENGRVKEVNFLASNFQFRKTFYNK